jgi:putative endonuclease
MYTVYVIENQKGERYVGHTQNMFRRLDEHNTGRGCRYTKRAIDWRVVYVETSFSRSEAMKREKYLKTGCGREWLKERLKTL